MTRAWLEERAKSLSQTHGPDSDVAHRLSVEKVAAATSDVSTLRADPGAFYAVELVLNLDTITPHVAGPKHVNVMRPTKVMETERIAIQKAYVVSCVNSRVQDLADAAAAIRGKQIAPGVEFYIAA